jgi:hypothetical protein
LTSLALAETRLKHLLALSKPRVVSLIVFCAVIGMFLASNGLPPAHIVLFATVGIALVAGAAAAINCLVEQKIDALMARTRRRPPVRSDVADALESPVQAMGGFEVRHENEVVVLTGAAVFLIDIADFGREHEAYGPATGGRGRRLGCTGGIRAEPEKPGLGRFQFGLDFRQPGRVAEVSGPDHLQPLDERCRVDPVKVEVARGGSRKPGMHV